MANGMVEQAGGVPPQGEAPPGAPPPPPDQGMPPQGEAPPGAPPSPGGMVQQGQEEEYGEEATAEEQKYYDAVVNMAGEFLYKNEKISDSVLKILQEGKESPEQNIAEVVSIIINKADEVMEGKLPETVIIPAAMEIAPMVAELSEQIGLIQIPDEAAATKVMAATTQRLFDDYGVDEADMETLAAQVPEHQAKQMVDDMSSMVGGQAPPGQAAATQAAPPGQAAATQAAPPGQAVAPAPAPGMGGI